MREEILRVCGPDGQPTYESVRELTYSKPTSAHRVHLDSFPISVRAVLNEVLRLFPPVPVNARASTPEGAVLPPSPCSKPNVPIYVPPETDIVYLPLLMHRRKDLWGEDAYEFKPGRWLTGDVSVTGYAPGEGIDRFVKNPMMWVPFNAGPRIVSGSLSPRRHL